MPGQKLPIRMIPADVERTHIEPLGSKPKFWYAGMDGQLRLFKEARDNTGEDWAEVVCAELAGALGLPHATYELATWGNARGVTTPSFIPHDGRLILGNELIGRPIADDDTPPRQALRHHRVGRVMAFLTFPPLKVPIGFRSDFAFRLCSQVFVGYLMLDALTGNQDRHDENWGLVRTGKLFHLLPTFDHASSLGRNESDEFRARRLSARDEAGGMLGYVRKARSRLYGVSSETRPLSTLAAFIEAAKVEREAANYWLNRLATLEIEDFCNVLDSIDDSLISQLGRDFAVAMLDLNRRRLLEIEL